MMLGDNFEDDSAINKQGKIQSFFKRISNTYQIYLDRFTPKIISRWVFSVILIISYFVRIFIKQGWFLITYALAIYYLSLLLAFLTPKINPILEEDDDDEGKLPTKQNEEFRPFIRKLPEFKVWYYATKGTIVAFFCTFFNTLNIPVFWPILFVYFLVLFFTTMKNQIIHMIHYKYIPFTYGKPRFS
uniref:Protein RER1 n=1 Tax=Lepeophtheirus salmonis TaxID=72036 RepID=A0A0K2U1D3_LEPSM